MDKHRKSKKRSLRIFFTAAILLTIIFIATAPLPALAAETEIISKTIIIEGTVERPKIIFIIPRAILLDSTMLDKSFTKEILKINHPLMWNDQKYLK